MGTNNCIQKCSLYTHKNRNRQKCLNFDQNNYFLHQGTVHLKCECWFFTVLFVNIKENGIVAEPDLEPPGAGLFLSGIWRLYFYFKIFTFTFKIFEAHDVKFLSREWQPEPT